jgi:tRNA wybutosine-synthesizing protein 3
MKQLPKPPPSFVERKQRILEQLAIPDADYTDASPKGSIDAGIRELIDEINRLDGFVTTSSCAGRVSVFVEGRKANDGEAQVGQDEDKDGNTLITPTPTKLAGVGGKGGGGNWLFVSHDPVDLEGSSAAEMDKLLGLRPLHTSGELTKADGAMPADSSARLIHFKFEPMVCTRYSNPQAEDGEERLKADIHPLGVS